MKRNEREREVNTLVKCVKLGFGSDVAQQIISELDLEILELDKDINRLSQNSSIEEFIDDIPEVLTKIFELCSKVLSNKEISTMRDEITKLVEITTFELSVSTKKELTVKLFEGLEDVLKLKNKEWLREDGFIRTILDTIKVKKSFHSRYNCGRTWRDEISILKQEGKAISIV